MKLFWGQICPRCLIPQSCIFETDDLNKKNELTGKCEECMAFMGVIQQAEDEVE